MALLFVATSCAGDDGSNGFGFATGGMGTAAGTAAGVASSTADDTGGAATGGAGPTTSGEGETAGATTAPGGTADSTGEDLPALPCIGMDILFVVDNSSTMIEEQIRISANAASWLLMVNAATATAINNINVGVITTDESSMVTQTAAPCAFASGLSYMQLSGAALDPVAFAAEVQCALSVGVAGSSDERPIERMFEALSPQFVDGAGPNAGFLRDDALLVVVLLTDEDDDFEPKTSWGSAGDPEQWISDLAAIKGDLTKDVVVLSMLGIDAPNACPPFQWDGATGAELSPRLQEFTLGFPSGAVHDLCSPDYTTFLSGMVPTISAACANFTPP